MSNLCKCKECQTVAARAMIELAREDLHLKIALRQTFDEAEEFLLMREVH